MFLIAGLGNPDKKYEKTRHNIGFDTVDALAEKYNISINDAVAADGFARVGLTV